MKKLTLSLFAVVAFAAASFAQITDTLSGTYTGNKWLRANKQYLLEGYVRIDSGARLLIEPGTIIKGDKETKGTLIIQQGGKIFCYGTNTNPVVFTSEEPIGSRASGDWGGIVICGYAPTNKGYFELEGGYGAFCGGNDPADNSGILNYVRIEFAGIPLQPNQEINGLTMGGVGSGTTIEGVMVSYGDDDSFEWFGGTVNAKRLISYKTKDDDFDTDYGYTGKVQFGIGFKDPMIADGSKSNGFECDNDGSGSYDLPLTNPLFSNMSMIGPYQTKTSLGVDALHENAAQIRRNARTSIYNSYFMGYEKGIYIDGAKSAAAAQTDSLQIKNTAVAGIVGSAVYTNVPSFNINDWFTMAANGDTIFPTNPFIGAKNPFKPNDPKLFLNTHSRVGDGTITPSFAGKVSDPFFTPTTYLGAMPRLVDPGFQDWTLFWTEWDPQNHDYCLGCATATRQAMYFEDAMEVFNYTDNDLIVSPNPAEGTTTFNFFLNESAAGSVSVLDINGNEVANFDANFNSGSNSVGFEAANLNTGIYIVRVLAGNEVMTSKFTVR